MYRCQVCAAVSSPGEPRKVHLVKQYRQIVREVPVCCGCLRALQDGQPLQDRVNQFKAKATVRPAATKVTF